MEEGACVHLGNQQPQNSTFPPCWLSQNLSWPVRRQVFPATAAIDAGCAFVAHGSLLAHDDSAVRVQTLGKPTAPAMGILLASRDLVRQRMQQEPQCRGATGRRGATGKSTGGQGGLSKRHIRLRGNAEIARLCSNHAAG